MMWSSLTDGSTIAFGNACAPSFVEGIAASLGAVMLPAEAVPASLGGTMPDPGVEAPAKPARKRREKPPYEPEATGVVSDPPTSVEAATVASEAPSDTVPSTP